MNGKQLKNSILQWAIQGKLVPQDPNDEPASVLLERIRAEKKRLIKEGKIKKDKNESIIYRGDDNSYYEKFADGTVKCIDEEIPYEIPWSWEWARLNDVCSYIQRGKSPVYSEIKQYPVIAQKCNQWSGFSIEKAQFIAPETVVKYSDERLLQENDLLWNSTGLGTLGRMAIYSEAKNPYGWAVADSHVTVIRPFQHFMNSLFLYAYFSSPTVQSVIEDKAEGSTKQKELYVDTVKTYLIPIPPYKEQNRIIEKIGSVLPIVAKYGHSQDKLDKLNVEINNRLRKSILQEAIQGKLIPQDPNDEPVSALLGSIQVEKLKLLKEGKLKKKDIVDSVIYKGEDNKYYEKQGIALSDISDEIPFEIPDSWQWCRLGSVILLQSGQDLTPDRYANTPTGIPYITGASNFLKGELTINRWTTSPTSISHDGDLLITCKGTVGTMAYNNTGHDIHIARQIMAIRPLLVNIRYIEKYLEFSSASLEKAAHSIIPGISRDTLLSALIPIPPLSEQIRIIRKIDEITKYLQ